MRAILIFIPISYFTIRNKKSREQLGIVSKKSENKNDLSIEHFFVLKNLKKSRSIEHMFASTVKQVVNWFGVLYNMI